MRLRRVPAAHVRQHELGHCSRLRRRRRVDLSLASFGRHAFLGEKSALRMLSSEAATLKYLRAHADYPVPEVFAYRYDFFPKGATVTEYVAPRLTTTSVYLKS